MKTSSQLQPLEYPDAIREVLEHLETQKIEIIEGPVKRTGASGAIESVYFRDPDDNLIEVSVYL